MGAIRAAARGETVPAPPVAARLVSPMRAPAVDAPTPRELEVLAGVARGLINAEIGRELFIGEATVKTHLLRVFASSASTTARARSWWRWNAGSCPARTVAAHPRAAGRRPNGSSQAPEASTRVCPPSLTQQEWLVALTPRELGGQVLGAESALRMTGQGVFAVLAGATADLLSAATAISALALASLLVSLALGPGLARAAQEAAAVVTRRGAAR